MQDWMEEYKEKLYNHQITIDEVQDFLDSRRPWILYKYFGFNEFWRKNLFEGQLFLQQAIRFNDPFDCMAAISKTKTDELAIEEFERLCPDVPRRIVEKAVKERDEGIVRQAIKSIRERTRVACFSEKNDSLLMWGHYGDKHMGFCIGYDLRRLDPVWKKWIWPVLYQDDMWDATQILFNSKRVNISLNQFLIKASDWSYEQEWRVVAFEDMFQYNEYFADFKRGICSVYLGIYENGNQDEIMTWARKYKVKVYRMRPSNTQYKMYPKQLH
jgi:hypothetical protein